MPHDLVSYESPVLERPLPSSDSTATERTKRFPERKRDWRRNYKAPKPDIRDYEWVIRNQLATLQAERSVGSLNESHLRLKRILDLSLTIPALVILSPLLLVIALAIRFDSRGPALFRQHRVGHNGNLFSMLKFRTMAIGSGVIINGVHKQRDDKRVTRVGRVLRKTSLDELPQLINVIRGEMSLVGPRPELPEIMVERYQPWQYERLMVPQGITGWWQVTGRGSKLMWQHTEDDVEYIQRASLWLDIKILLRTFRAVLDREGAF